MKLNFFYPLKAHDCKHKQDSVVHLQEEVLGRCNAFYEIN